MAALVEGCYALAPIPIRAGAAQGGIATMYNTDRYRPNYANKLGLPIFLTSADEFAWTACGRAASPSGAADPATIRAFFNEAAADEEHYPSTIDPRILHVKVVLEHIWAI